MGAEVRVLHSRYPMRLFSCLLLLISAVLVRAEEPVSTRVFPPIALANHVAGGEAIDGGDIGCGFLLRSGDHVYAVTAKHILRVVKNRTVQLAPHVTSWTMFSKADRKQAVTLGRLVNEDPNEKLGAKESGQNDWLVFEMPQVPPGITALQARTQPLRSGEKVYVVGWTCHQTDGAQRVYEWEYVKTVGTRLLLKPLIVPPTFGGLSGAPVVDADGRVVGLVSNDTTDPDDGRKYFSPCSVVNVVAFLARREQ